MSEENEKVSEATYSEESLFKKIGHVAVKAGIKLIYVVLLLYYTLIKPTTPVGAKMTILVSLGVTFGGTVFHRTWRHIG
jgi:hypothetical protein